MYHAAADQRLGTCQRNLGHKKAREQTRARALPPLLGCCCAGGRVDQSRAS